MPSLNTSIIEIIVQNNINQLTTASTVNSLVLPVTVVDLVEIGVSSSVDAKVNLPNLFTGGAPDGHVVFVKSISMHVVSSQCEWLSFDGRSFRNDAPVKTAWSWGCNSLPGQLGDNTTVAKSSPVSVVGGFTNWCQVSAAGGGCHTVAVRTNGTAWAWGNNTQGQLGDGTVTYKSSPVSVMGGFSDWCQVSGGRYHTAAVRTTGSLWAWGGNTYGKLGDGSTTNRTSPVSVVGGFTDWCQVSAGRSHTVAVRTNGTAWAWGYNNGGLLGDGTVTSRSSPVSVVGGFTNWCQVSAGGLHNVAVRTNGTAWAWGDGQFGRLGDGTDTNKSSPVSVVGGFTDWCQVSAGMHHTVGVRTNGSLWSWGYNGVGRLGDGGSTNRSSPGSVAGGFSDWCQVSAGFYHTAAVRTNGTAWAWGNNGAGRLGDGTTTNRLSPVSVVGGFCNWSQVSGGRYHTVAIRVS